MKILSRFGMVFLCLCRIFRRFLIRPLTVGFSCLIKSVGKSLVFIRAVVIKPYSLADSAEKICAVIVIFGVIIAEYKSLRSVGTDITV